MIKGPREVEFDLIQGRPIFKDTMTPTGQSICRHCGKYVDTRYPDPCLKKLPGVRYACCGHGERWQSYIVFKNGLTIRGFVNEKEWENDLVKIFRYKNLMHKIKRMIKILLPRLRHKIYTHKNHTKPLDTLKIIDYK